MQFALLLYAYGLRLAEVSAQSQTLAPSAELVAVLTNDQRRALRAFLRELPAARADEAVLIAAMLRELTAERERADAVVSRQ